MSGQIAVGGDPASTRRSAAGGGQPAHLSDGRRVAVFHRKVFSGRSSDVVLAVVGLGITQLRILHAPGGWPHAPVALLVLVALAPALIAVRRVDPVLASVGLVAGAFASLLLGQTDWVLLTGCGLALWSLPARCRLSSTLATTVVTAALPLLAATKWLGLLHWAYPSIYTEFPERASETIFGITQQGFDKIKTSGWPWWQSIALLLVGCAGVVYRRRRTEPRTAGERLDDLWAFLLDRDRAVLLDCLLAVAVASTILVEQLAATVLGVRLSYLWGGQADGSWWSAPDWMPYAIAYSALTLALRRRWPGVPVTVLTASALLTCWQTSDSWSVLGALAIALHSLGAAGGRDGPDMTASRRAIVVDLALAATGLVISLARSWDPETGWLHGDLVPVLVVVLAPALIALRRVMPVAVAVGLMSAALVALMLGQFDWVLIGGCALALWSVAALRTWLAAAAVVVVTAVLPLLANWRWGALVRDSFGSTYSAGSQVEYMGQLVPGVVYGVTPEDLDRFLSRNWPWWLSAALAAVWLAGCFVRRYRRREPVVVRHGTPGDWLEALRQFAARRENVLWVDAMLAISLAALQLLDIRRGQAISNWWVSPDWLIYAIAAAPLSLVLRRILPVVPCVLLAAASLPAFWAADDIPFLLVALAVALFSLASHRRLLLALPLAALLLVAVPVLSRLAIEHYQVQLWFFPVLTKTIDPGKIQFGPPLHYGYEYFRVAERIWPVSLSVVLALAPVLGVLARVYRRTREGVAREAELKRRTAEQDAAQVVLTERSHIARDLHDVVAHAVNLIVIQAETGPDLLERGDKDVLAGFQRIGDAGRRALGELDRMLSALRDAEGVPDPALTPQPGLADLPRLVEDVSHELTVELDLQGDPGSPPDGHQLAAYRLVQEALTNVVRHARASKVAVTVAIGNEGIQVEVVDDGRGFEPDIARTGGRHGLAGMRERVRIHDGSLQISSSPGAGTTVAARIPLTKEELAPA